MSRAIVLLFIFFSHFLHLVLLLIASYCSRSFILIVSSVIVLLFTSFRSYIYPVLQYLKLFVNNVYYNNNLVA
jgi:hypothetical protein